MAKSPKKTRKSSPTPSFWNVGKVYMIRGVNMYQVGRLISIDDHELILEDAAWIADTGRFNQALTSKTFNEVEPFTAKRIAVGRGQIVDAFELEIDLPLGVK
jgi:hypothetical protein